jgi:hypothetical protein
MRMANQSMMNSGAQSSASEGRRPGFAVDLAFIGALLAFVAAWLAVRRDNLWLHTAPFTILFYLVFGLLVWSWARSARRAGRDVPRVGTDETIPSPSLRKRWIAAVLAGLLLGCLTRVCFYEPLKIHFWGGHDEDYAVIPTDIWSTDFEQRQNRPLAMMFWWLAQQLRPDRIESRLWVATGLCFLNSVLIYAIVRRVAPSAAVVAASAAMLFLVNRGDEARFLVMWTTVPYWGPLVLLLAATWLLLLSHGRGSRPLLAAACFTLGASVLINEGTYPLALLGLVLLWLTKRNRKDLVLWSCAWMGTLAVMAVRVVLFLLNRGTDSYQGQQVSEALRHPGRMIANFKGHLDAALNCFTGFSQLARHWEWGLLALAAALLLFLVVHRAGKPVLARRSCLVGMGVAVLAALLGLLPTLHIPGLFRTHLLVAPGEAVLLAFALGWLGSFLPGQWGSWFVGFCTATLVAGGTIATFRMQERALARSEIFFEKTVHVFRQVHALAPNFSPDAAVLFVLDDGILSPLGNQNHVEQVSRVVLGCPAYQANTNFPPDCADRVVMTADGIDYEYDTKNVRQQHRFDQVVAFRLSADGGVSLLRELPEALLPAGHHGAAYNPLPLIQPGPVDEPPFMRYARWMRPRLDILDASPGTMRGAKWSALAASEKRLFRVASDEAEIAVNPMGQGTCTLNLEVEPPSSPGTAWELLAVDTRGRTLASAPLNDRAEVRLTVSANRDRIQVCRLRLMARAPADQVGKPAPAFRVFRPGKPVKTADLPQPPKRDVPGPGLRLGANWYPFETFGGMRFRWVNNDAEILPGVFPIGGRTRLALEVMPGVSMAGKPCHLQLLDGAGDKLGDATFTQREFVHFTLPKPFVPGDILRLHVDGGGAPAPGDPRILNFMVFSCDLLE